MITVAIVDDHPIVRDWFARMAESTPELWLLAAAEKIEDLPSFDTPPDVVVLDLRLPSPLQGLVGVRHLTDRGFRVLVMTGQDVDMRDVADAVTAGAQGYLSKHAQPNEYVAAIRAVASGRVHIGARLAAQARRDSAGLSPSDPNRLTQRESEIAGFVADGYTNAEIADILHISERTVDGHVESIKQKLCEGRRVRVALRLQELGYQPPPGRRRETGG